MTGLDAIRQRAKQATEVAAVVEGIRPDEYEALTDSLRDVLALCYEVERLRRIEDAARLGEGVLSLIFYRAEVNWGHLGVPSKEFASKAISALRDALKEQP